MVTEVSLGGAPGSRFRWTAPDSMGTFEALAIFLPQWLLESKCCPEQAQVLCQESSHFVLQSLSLSRP